MIGEQIRVARSQRRWTQSELAERLSKRLGRPLKQAEISGWETEAKYPSAPMVGILADVLGTELQHERRPSKK